MRLVALAVVVACLTGACSSGSGDSSSSTTTTTTAPTAGAVPTSATPDSACATFRGATQSLSSTGERPASLLIDADAESIGCLDKVTFTFETLGNGLPPGYSVAYRDLNAEPLKDGDTEISAPPGSAFLVVTMTPAASTDPRVDDHPPTYRGNLRLSYGKTNHLDSVLKLPDTKDSVQWVIGLDSMRPFLVDSAMNPPRVSIYIG